ncbi:MAG: hypothetical protein IPM24_07725 [Bryobacterales bacterium]|nr:hypothetical protein [Bryobacterales bacterium]
MAAANGHPPAEPGWCTCVEEWLVESEYLPDPTTVDRFADQVEKAVGQAAMLARLAVPVEQLKDLLARLRQPARKIKRRPPKPDRKPFRELVRWLNSSTGEADPGTTFDRQGNASVYLYHVTAQAACKLVNYRKVRSLELPLNESNEPRELEAALRILLRGWSHTLEYLLIDDVPDATPARNRPKYLALAGCAAELGNLPALKTLIAIRVYFDDELLSRVCQNPRLSLIEVKAAEISKRAIESLERCRSLKTISIVRCPEFPHAYRDELVSRCPHAKIIEVSPSAEKAGKARKNH